MRLIMTDSGGISQIALRTTACGDQTQQSAQHAGVRLSFVPGATQCHGYGCAARQAGMAPGARNRVSLAP
ncbi:hypothetical protein GCM10022240_17140 [Microbacterium kribbense]|uniref:Uncharacterized protein n=1 Tax=Microbacterium kribbense TaxID=433645 RepID=A0ABP7GGW7_9MICO